MAEDGLEIFLFFLFLFQRTISHVSMTGKACIRPALGRGRLVDQLDFAVEEVYVYFSLSVLSVKTVSIRRKKSEK